MQVRGFISTVTAVAVLAACSSSSAGPRETTGTVAGIVSSTQGGGIAGATVVVTPSSGMAMAAVVTNSSGTYQVLNVPAGTGDGAISVSHLPSTCAPRDSTTYTGLIAGQSATANVAVPCTFAATGIVIWFALANSIAGLTAAQLVGGLVNPTEIAVGQPTAGLAFDASGNLWVAVEATSGTAQNNYVYEFAPSQLTTSTTTPLTPAVAIELPATFMPVGLAFDRSGTLWLTGAGIGLLYGFSANQLTTNGAPTPAHAFQLRDDSATALALPTFAANGDLWIPGQDPTNGAGFLLRLTAAQLGSPSGRLAPADSVLSGRGLDPSIDPAKALAFDTAGNLWVNGGDVSGASYFSMFPPTSLPGSRGDTVDIAPTVRVNANLATFGGIAFDRSGNLWSTPFYLLTNPINYLLRYPAAAIPSGGSVTPDVVDTLNIGLATPTGLAFAPHNGAPLLQVLKSNAWVHTHARSDHGQPCRF